MKEKYRNLSDEELFRLVKAGDKDAFEVLVERYKKKAYYLALQLVGDPAEAKDISQEAFVRVYRHRKRFDESKLFFSWFYTILSNLSRNYHKKSKVRSDYRKTVQDEHKSDGGNRSLSPDVILEADETREMVWAAIEKLSFEHREIIVLRHFEDLSYEDIAKAIGIPLGSVMSRLYYARKQLKDILGDIGE